MSIIINQSLQKLFFQHDAVAYILGMSISVMFSFVLDEEPKILLDMEPACIFIVFEI